MLKKIYIKLLLLIIMLIAVNGFSQTTLTCDFTNSTNRLKTIQYHWNTYNSISPINSFRLMSGPYERVNVVRPLGGKYDRKTGMKLISEDTYKWDGEKYYYDWEPLKKIINNVINKTELYQLVLDNPSWAFQRGLNLEEKDSFDTYGNPWAPNDAVAWANYIKAMLHELIKTYGREKVGKWRYCIGREIGTPGHWRSGETAFFEHYKNTEKVIREVLPEAQVGTHLLWGSDRNSYGQKFIPWSKANGAKYDFLGISYYPKYTSIKSVSMDSVYKRDIAPLIELPEWNKKASFEIHEYALIEAMVNHQAIRAPVLHRNIFPLMMAKLLYEKNLGDVFVWSDAPVYKESLILLKNLKGHDYYSSKKEGIPQIKGSMIDAIFSKSDADNLYEITAYHYNANPNVIGKDSLKLAATLPITAKKRIKYRVGRYIDSEVGLQWSSWEELKTKMIIDDKKSIVSFYEAIPAFSYLKYEILVE